MKHLLATIALVLLAGCNEGQRYTLLNAPNATVFRIDQKTGEVCAFRHFQDRVGSQITTEGLALVGCANNKT